MDVDGYRQDVSKLLDKCMAVQYEDGPLYFALLDVCEQLELCPICAPQAIHDLIAVTHIDSPSGQKIPIAVVDYATICYMVAGGTSPVCERLRGYLGLESPEPDQTDLNDWELN